MIEIIQQFLRNTSWLYTKLYENPIFFIDYWSFNHIWSGSIITLLMITFKVRHKWLFLILLLVGWELLEILFQIFAIKLYLIETLKDQITDVLLGFAAGWLTYFILLKKEIFNPIRFITPDSVSAVFTSISIAFFWVGFYHYHYSRAEFNSPGINYWALLLWFTGYLSILKYYSFLQRKIKNIFFRIPLLWLTYFFVLFTIEYIGRYVVEIKEVSSPYNTPLIFGLIYGSPTLHFFYSMAPIFAILIFLPLRKLFNKATDEVPELKLFERRMN